MNQPAFPTWTKDDAMTHGMTLRDFFAAAALQGMYSLEVYPKDHYFWELLSYCAGTGGSCLIIGSAAGVAVMGMEKIDFFWYLKKISWVAVIGYLSGALFFILQHNFFS